MSLNRKITPRRVCAFIFLLFSLSLAAFVSTNLIVTIAGTSVAGYSGDGGPAQYAALNHPEIMVFDSNGNMYVSESGDNRVRKIDTNGNITTVAGNGSPGFSGDTGAATLAQLSYPIGLALDGNNNLYIVDQANQRVRKVALGTGVITTVAGNGTRGFSADNVPAISSELNNPHSIASDSAGNLYIADQTNNRVRKVSAAGTITTVAGTGVQAGSGVGAGIGDGGLATSALLNAPGGIALDSTGTMVYVAEQNGHRVRQFMIGGNITTFAGTGFANFSGDGTAATAAALSSPLGLSLDAANNLYISDRGNQRIRLVSGGTINTVAGTNAAGFAGDGGLATSAVLLNPVQAVEDPSNPSQFYITDWGNHRIRKSIVVPTGNPSPQLTSLYPSNVVAGSGNFTLTVYGSSFVPGATVQWNGNGRATTYVSSTILTATILNTDVASATTSPVTVLNPGVTASSPQTFTVITSAPKSVDTEIITFAGNGNNNYGGDGGPALYASFSSLVQTTFDLNGNMYVMDDGNGVVRKIDTSGNITTIAGGGGSNLENIPATAAQLYAPSGVAVDSTATNLYIAEYSGHRIRRVVLATGNISTYAGPTPQAGNTPGFGGDGGPALQASFRNPSSLTIDPAGNLYVVDRSNERIRKITPNGANISTIAGNGINGFYGDGGPAIYTPLNDPYQIARDSVGNLYVAEAGGDRIRKIDTLGNANTIAGTGNCCFSGDGGLATSANVNGPEGIAVDSNFNVYFGEAGSARVRIISGGIINTVAGNGTGAFGGDGGLAVAAQISNQLNGMSMDAAGNVYISDLGNYRIRRLQQPTSNNPVPTLTLLAPAGIQAGSGNFTLAVNGTNFVPGAIVQWNGSNRATTFASSTLLYATINNFDVATANTATVNVLNPPTGGGTATTGLTFTTFNPPAAPTSIIITYAGNGINGYSGNGGPAINASFSGINKVIFDSNGNMYEADGGNHVVRKITPAGIVSTFAGTGSAGDSGDTGPANFAQLNNPVGLALDGNGNLYIGEYGGARIRKVVLLTGIITTIAGGNGTGYSGDSGMATAAQLDHPLGIASDAAGNIYIADQASQRIRKVSTSGIITTVAGNGGAGFLGDGGPATDTTLYNPTDVALDSTGTILFIVDQYNQRIRKVDANGNISTVAGNGNGGYCCDGGPATSAQLYYPVGIAVDSAGNLYIGDIDDQRIRKVNTLGIMSTIAGGNGQGYNGDGELATSAQLNQPQWLTVGPGGNIYFGDTSNFRVRAIVPAVTSSTPAVLSSITPSSAEVGGGAFTLTVNGSNFAEGAVVQWNGAARTTNYISSTKLLATINAFDIASLGTQPVTVLNPGSGSASNSRPFNIIAVPTPPTTLIITTVGNGIAAYAGDTGAALFASINNPQGLAYDQAGNLYIADCNNNVVRKVTTGGTITTFAGTGTAGYNQDGIPATSSELHCPVGLAFDVNQNLYIADNGNFRIRQVTPGGIILTVAGTGANSFGGDNGPATSAQMSGPQGVALDSAGNLYFSDYSNYRVRKVVIGGNITTFAGTGAGGFEGDGGPAITSTLDHPLGLAFDSVGNLYIADSYNMRVRKVDLNGNMSTVAGNGGSSFGGDGGPATSAQLSYPNGVFADNQNPPNLYIADQQNYRIREVTSGGIIFTIAGNGVCCGTYSGDGGLATNAGLSNASYVTLDPSGNVTLSDAGNNRIRKLVPPSTTSPTPSLIFLNPARAQVGGGTFTLSVYGTNFVPGATVQFNGNPQTTNFVSTNLVQATIQSFNIASTGSPLVAVVNPGTGGSSGNLTFTVFPTPAPSTTLIQTVGGSGYAGYSGDGGPALYSTFNGPVGMAVDSTGSNLYVADYSNNRVRKITVTNGVLGNITTIAGNGTAGSTGDNGPAIMAELNNPAGLALDTSGNNLYIAEYAGNRIRKVVLSTGTITTVAGTGASGYFGDGAAATLAKLQNPYGIALDSNGNLFIADRYNHRIRRVDSVTGNISTFAGTGVAGFFGDGGPATTTPINQPLAVIVDLLENVYISEYGGNRIRRVGPDGTVYTVAGNGAGNSYGDGGPATSAALSGPIGIFLDANNNLYIADYGNQKIREVTGGVITTIAGNGTNAFAGDGGLAGNANLSSPEFVLVFGGNVFFTDTGNQRIREILLPPSNNPLPVISSIQPSSAQQGGATFTMLVNGSNFVPGSTVQWNGFARTTVFLSPNELQVVINNFDIAVIGSQTVTVLSPTTGGGGGPSTPPVSFLVFPTPVASTAVINTFSGSGTPGFLDGAPGTAKFNNPQHMTFDAQGNLYVADCTNNRVREITANGTVSTVAGGGGSLGDNGPATSAQLNCPVGVAFDGLGNLYISEQNGNRIRRVSSGTITTIAGNGTAGFAGDGGPAANSQVNEPNGLALDAAGNLYIADYRTYRVREITIANGVVGNINTVAGNGISGYFGDGGPAIDSPLVGPAAVAVDVHGNLYISDYDGNRIRMVDGSGNIHLVAGTGAYNCCGDTGPAIYATFRNPYQIAIDNSGNIYVADGHNNRVRKIDSTGVITTIAGTGTANFSGDTGLAANATLNSPYGIALDSAGDLFIADAGNDRIREIPAVTGTTCLYSIAPNSANFGAAATTGSFNVITSAGCFWSVGSNSAPLTITSPTGNSGPGQVTFSVAANPNPAPRAGTITAAGLTYTANQAGTGCTFVLGPPASATLGAAATSGNTVAVTAPTGCTWTAVSNSSFIHITAGSSGSGNGQVTYNVDANPNAQALAGSMTIGAQIFPVNQAGVACMYSILTSSANYTSSGATGTVNVIATTGCTWSAVSNQPWLLITSGTSGSGNGFVAYSVVGNNLSVGRTATITVSGTIYTVNQQGFVSPAGSVTANSGTGSPGGSPRIPIVLNLPTGQLDSISFGVSIAPVGGAPAITAPLSFAADPLMPTPTESDPGVPGAISVTFLNMITPISGAVALGQVQVTIPASATVGQSYTVTITGADGSSAGTPVTLSSGPNATLLLSSSYLVGDTYPLLTNFDNDNYDSSGEFGDGLLQTLDLIYTLRQVVSIPGFTAPVCSDRFDAMDSYPVDTVNTRGGNGTVDNLDLITTLRRVTNVDSSRPIRGTRGMVCPSTEPQSLQKPVTANIVGQLELGAAREDGRIPVYLHVDNSQTFSALSFSIGGAEQKLTFVGVDGAIPTLSDNGARGFLALAWLEGFAVQPGRTLIGYVEGAKGKSLAFYGVHANARDGQEVRITFPEVR
jgi:sugar lactone lactonase YvrE